MEGGELKAGPLTRGRQRGAAGSWGHHARPRAV